MASLKELLEELKLVFSGRNSIIDAAIPPVIFIIINATIRFMPAVWISLGAAVVVILLRLMRRQPIRNALGGLGAALAAVLLVFLLNSSEAFFLPTIVNGALMVVVLSASVLLKRPAVAWTSHLTRRWPLDWYWHPKVRPAYSEVSLIWVVYSTIKLTIQIYLYQNRMVDELAVFNLTSGWPTLIILLISSYIYGLKRLSGLKGPSVEEYMRDAPPPWEGQKRGF